MISYSRENKRFEILQLIETAKVPVLKMKDTKYNFDIDIINVKDDKLFH
jgi:DNA polymerase sigma